MWAIHVKLCAQKSAQNGDNAKGLRSRGGHSSPSSA
jgi:hypothetical protein